MLRCCCALCNNNASDVRPADALAAGVGPSSQTLTLRFVFCAVGLLQYQPADPEVLSLVIVRGLRPQKFFSRKLSHGFKNLSSATFYRPWQRLMSKRFIKHPYFLSSSTPIDSDYCRLHTPSVLSNSGQITPHPVLTFSMPHIIHK